MKNKSWFDKFMEIVFEMSPVITCLLETYLLLGTSRLFVISELVLCIHSTNQWLTAD